jgi:hypothetical protein
VFWKYPASLCTSYRSVLYLTCIVLSEASSVVAEPCSWHRGEWVVWSGGRFTVPLLMNFRIIELAQKPVCEMYCWHCNL